MNSYLLTNRRLSFLLTVLLFLVGSRSTSFGQTITTYTTNLPPLDIQHVFVQVTYSNNETYVVGDLLGTLEDESNLISGATVVESISCTDADCYNLLSEMQYYCDTYSYDLLTQNCGDALNFGLSQAGISSSVNYNSLAVISTAINWTVVGGVIGSFFPGGYMGTYVSSHNSMWDTLEDLVADVESFFINIYNDVVNWFEGLFNTDLNGGNVYGYEYSGSPTGSGWGSGGSDYC